MTDRQRPALDLLRTRLDDLPRGEVLDLHDGRVRPIVDQLKHPALRVVVLDHLREEGYTIHAPGEGCAPRLRVERPRARRTDPETSAVAGRRVSLRAGSQAARLLAAYAKRESMAVFAQCSATTAEDLAAVSYPGAVGLTDEEAAELARLPVRSCWWKRCSELREDGLITPALDLGTDVITRKSETSGDERMVCRITDAGRAELERLAGLAAS